MARPKPKFVSDTNRNRFFLDRDESGHWYLIPVSRRSEWEQWGALGSDDERAWSAPDYAQRLGGSPANVTFTDPVDE